MPELTTAGACCCCCCCAGACACMLACASPITRNWVCDRSCVTFEPSSYTIERNTERPRAVTAGGGLLRPVRHCVPHRPQQAGFDFYDKLLRRNNAAWTNLIRS